MAFRSSLKERPVIRFRLPPREKPQQALPPLLSGLELPGEDSNLEPSG